MENFINEYLIFILKIIAITILVILATLAILITIILLTKKKTPTIKIENINKKYLNLQMLLYSNTLEKKDFKNIKTKIKIDIKNTKHIQKNNVYLLNFNGDIHANEINTLREIISAIIAIAKKNDEVLIILNSSGGLVNNYGLAASLIKRIRDNNINLTISVDLIAASGGYLIACVANKIIASHFSIIGSIGVIGQVPNFNKLLLKNNIKIEEHTSGEYKRTLTIFGKNEDKGREKFKDLLKNTHNIFKEFVKKNRPIVSIDEISTGEYWYGTDALKLKLIDEIKTSDEYLKEKMETKNVYEITQHINHSFKNLLKEKTINYIKNTLKIL
ncbi:MAG: protease SohB [Enterobacteriaceae bacterium]|nr:protease SohB [Enterobacteriaceae bacterium]